MTIEQKGLELLLETKKLLKEFKELKEQDEKSFKALQEEVLQFHELLEERFQKRIAEGWAGKSSVPVKIGQKDSELLLEAKKLLKKFKEYKELKERDEKFLETLLEEVGKEIAKTNRRLSRKE